MSGEVPSIEEFENLANTIKKYDSDATRPVRDIDAPVEYFCKMFKNIKCNKEIPRESYGACPCHTAHKTNAVNLRIIEFLMIYIELRNYLKNSKKGISPRVKELFNI